MEYATMKEDLERWLGECVAERERLRRVVLERYPTCLVRYGMLCGLCLLLGQAVAVCQSLTERCDVAPREEPK